MRPESIERAAKLLRDVRLKHELLDELPVECRPTTIDDAYAIQDRLAELLGEQFSGWLVGCTNQDVQQQLGLTEPYAARMLSSSLHTSPATVHVPLSLPPVVEVEFAFTLASDLPPRSVPYTEQQVAAAVRSVHPAIELVVGHFRDWPSNDIYSVVADNGTDGPLILGKGVTDWQSVDLTTVSVALSVNGRLVREGSGSRVLQGPLSVLTWLANCPQRPPGLLAGHVINTGTCTSLYHARHGDAAIADFGPLGAVNLQIAARK